jgi:archaellum component FlaC
MGVEGRLEDELSKMKLEMHKKEDRISGVSAEFERLKDNVEKLKDLKISFKRFENTFGSNFGLLSHDLDNLKTAFELLRITSSANSKSKIKTKVNIKQPKQPPKKP